MGLILNILGAPIAGPIRFLQWTAEKVNETVHKERTDKSKIQAELLSLQMRMEMDDITEEEFTKREDELLARLDEINKIETGEPIEKKTKKKRGAYAKEKKAGQVDQQKEENDKESDEEEDV